jgi:hypothetical protein
VWGNPGVVHDVIPLPEHAAQQLIGLILTLIDRTAALALEPGSLAQRERYVRYYFGFCDLLNQPRVIRGPGQMWQLSGFAALLGIVWTSQRHVPNQELGLNHETVRGAVSQVTAWHFEMHGEDIKRYGNRAKKVVRGLKTMAGPTLPLLHMSYRAFKFIVRRLLNLGSPRSVAIAHAIMWLFLGLFRISEIASTTSHNVRDDTARFLLNVNVTIKRASTTDGRHATRGEARRRRVRSITWTLPKTKWKDEEMNRELYAEGCRPLEEDDTIVDLDNDFATSMAARQLLNETFLLTHPNQRETLAFIHVNGEPLDRAEIHAAIVEGLAAGHASHGLENPDLYVVSTHSGRRGGATYYAENGASDKFLCWLGRWASVAWLHYVKVTSGVVCLVSGLLRW